MAGTPQINTSDAVGVPPLPSTDIPSRVAIIAAAHAGTQEARARQLTSAILSEYTAGPLVRSGRHVLGSTRQPIVTVRCTATNPGTYDTIDVTGVSGTCVPAVNAATVPRDECEAYWIVVDGCTIGTAGGTYKESTNAGRSLSGLKKLGTATYLQFSDQGIRVDLDPPSAQVTVFIALATEIRADLKTGHFADAVAHNSADATAAALITLPAPTTGAEAWAVLNQCRLAWASHLANQTAHDSADIYNTLSAAAADSIQGGITIALELKADINSHLAATYPAAAASLKALTASSVAVQVYDASDLLAAGVLQLNRYPSYITFTTDAAGTPADAPADVVITGTNADTGLADTDTVTVSQIAGTATAAKRFLADDDLLITYGAGGGTGALISIGTTAAAHNSADVTNTISSTSPTRGTLVAGDVIQVSTNAPYPSDAELADAFEVLAESDLTPGIILLPGRTPVAYGTTISTGLDLLAENGKPCRCIVQARQANSETQAELREALETEWDAVEDDRILVCATDALATFVEGNVARQRFTGYASQFAVRRVLNSFWETTWKVQPAFEDVTIVDANGDLVGYDEPRDVETRLQVVYRVPNAELGRPTVPSVDKVLAAEADRIKEFRVGQIRDEIARVIEAWGWGQIGTLASVTVINSTSGTLDENKRQSLERGAAAALAGRAGLALGISDIEATDLVSINPTVELDGSTVYLDLTVNWTPVGAIGRIDNTLSVRTGSA